MADEMYRNYDFSLGAFQRTFKGEFKPEEFIGSHEDWSRYIEKGKKLVENLDAHINIKTNGNYLDVFYSVIQGYEEWFYEGFPQKKHENYSHIAPIMICLYDMLLSLKRAYISRSATNSSIITRTIFEAMITLTEISNNPVQLSKQFTRYKRVAQMWHEYKNEVLDKDKLKALMKSYPEWYDEDWKTMKSKSETWTGIKRDTIFNRAIRTNHQESYEYFYRSASAFTHVSPLISNVYSIQYGPVAKEKAVFTISYIGLNFLIHSLEYACKIVEHETDAITKLRLPFAVISRAEGMS